jgi:hypothetical protein
MSIDRKKVSLLLPEVSPVISLAHGGEDCLDLLLKAGLPIVITDQVLYEATHGHKDGFPDASAVREWYEKHKAKIKVVKTKIGEARAELMNVGKYDHKKFANQGEASVLQAMNDGKIKPGPYLFLFEEEKMANPSYFGAYPVHLISTYGFLVGLERAKIISSADDIL